MASIQVRQTAPDTYRLRLRLGGMAKDAYRFHHGTRAEADTAAAAWLHEATQRGPAPASPATTLGAWLDQLLTLATHLEPRTRHNYGALRRLHFGAIERRRLHSLTPADGIDFQRALLDDGCGPVTVRQCYRLAKWALGEAARMRILPANPFAEVRAVRAREPDIKAPAGAQLRAVQHAATGRVGLLLRLALATGARRGELLALTWSAIDLTAGRLTIAGSLERDRTDGSLRVKLPKTRTGRRSLALPADMVAELRAVRIAAAETALAAGRRVAELPVLPDEAGLSWWTPDAATMAAHRALREAALPGSLHGLRHAHATALLQARMNPRAVQQRLGHANVSTTLGIYAHAMPGDDEAAAAAIQAAISTAEVSA